MDVDSEMDVQRDASAPSTNSGSGVKARNTGTGTTAASFTAADGNYRSYYKFRSQQQQHNQQVSSSGACNADTDSNSSIVASDPRLAYFETSWFQDMHVLDLGCNEGKLTLEIAKRFQPKLVVGIDIDRKLIATANSAVKRAVYEHHKQRSTHSTMLPAQQASIATATTEAMHTQKQLPFSSSMAFVPRSITLQHPPLQPPLLRSMPIATGVFPFNIKFGCDDIMTSLPSTASQSDPDIPALSISAGRFDTILSMSVVKWIHLNHGDMGLVEFFRRLFTLAAPGGRVILEYQPWKSYVNNKAITEHIKSVFPTIRIKPEDFEQLLTSPTVGFHIESRRGTPLAEARSFNRPILVLQKPLPQLSITAMGCGTGSAEGDSMEGEDEFSEQPRKAPMQSLMTSFPFNASASTANGSLRYVFGSACPITDGEEHHGGSDHCDPISDVSEGAETGPGGVSSHSKRKRLGFEMR